MSFTAAEARDRPRGEIIYLADIQTLNGGPLLRFADRNKSVGGVAYTAYLASVSGVGDTLSRATGGFVSSAITVIFRNEPWDAYAYLTDLSETYPLEGAAITLKTCHLDDDGTPATPETVFVGNLDSPTSITEISFTCAVLCREAFISQQTR